MAASLWLASGCTQSFSPDDEFGPLPPPPPGVGTEEWGQRDITCSGQSDCGAGESCIDNICQMTRCGDGPYSSIAPLGESLTLALERQLIAADSEAQNGAYWIDGYEAAGPQLTHMSSASWNFGSSRILDLAGGNFYGESPERFAAALEGSNEIAIRRDGVTERINIGFQPIALDAGDVDFDGLDDLVALSADGRFALCKAPEEACRTWSWNGDVQGIDVAVADIDGDGFAEAVFLIKNGGRIEVIVWNPHHEQTGEDEFYGIAPGSGTTDSDFKHLAAGDLTGDGVAEIVAIHDRIWPYDHRAKVYRAGAGTLTRVADFPLETRGSKHIAIGNLNPDQPGMLLLLRDDRNVDIWRAESETTFSRVADNATLSVTSNAFRIAMADVRGDSPVLTRVSGPELIPGPVVPVIAAEFPPYNAAVSGGGGVPGAGGAGSNLFLGDTETTSEDLSDSVSVRAGIAVGFEAKLFGVLGASARTRVTNRVEYTESISRGRTIGGRHFVLPNTDLYGPSYGVVMLSAGCFHGYTYRLSDPAGRIASDVDGSTVFGVVPVDGQSTLWSTNRYNALAERIDYLPTIEIPTEIGNVESYPRSPERLDGTPVPPEHMLFPEPPVFLVSDTGRVGWWLSVSESQAQQVAMSTEVSISGSLSAGMSIEAEIAGGIGQAYSVSVGNDVLFGGAVPPIEDDPNTPESEYERYYYSFAPYVYRETYSGPDGEETGFYMLRFTVGR
jgi:hypothetical protein